MSDTQNEYADLDDDVGLDEGSKQFFGPKQEWLKMTKGQVLRAAFLYFHSFDSNAVAAAKRANKGISKEEMLAVGRKALEERAKALGKAVDQLTEIDKTDVSQVHFKKMDAHFQQGMGFVLSRLGKDGPEADAVWKKLPEPKMYFSTLLLIYPTDREGGLDKEGLQRGEWRVIPWRFGKKTYENVWKLNEGLRGNNLSIASQDIKLDCKDAQYQNIEVSFAGPALWQKSENFKAKVLAKAVEFYKGSKLIPFREMTTDQLRQKLGLGGSSVTDVSSGSDFNDLLENV